MTNVVGLHEGGRLARYASLLVEFGLVGDMMHDCENFRWMGPSRYNGELKHPGNNIKNSGAIYV